MTDETAVWVNTFVELHQTDIGQQIACLQAQVKSLEAEKENGKSQQLKRESLSKKLLYYHAQLDLLKVLILAVIN